MGHFFAIANVYWFILSGLTLSGCASSPETQQVNKKQELDSNTSEDKTVNRDVEKSAQKAKESAYESDFKAELELGRNMAGRLLALSQPYYRKDATEYVNIVGAYVASFSEFKDRRFMFEILDDDAINAFACPGGYILVTLGALRFAENEAELAFILAHEIAHVGNQHVLKALRLKSDDKAPAKIQNSSDVRRRPEPPKSELGDSLAKSLMGTGGAGMGLFQAVDMGMKMILSEGLDHKLEFEADDSALKLASKAGYDSAAMLKFFDRLAQKKSEVKTKGLEKTHPTVENRKQKLNLALGNFEGKMINGAIGAIRFNKFKSMLRPEKIKKLKN